MTNKNIELLKQSYPFITGIQYCDDDYMGIIVNYDSQVTTIYDLNLLHSDMDREEFLRLGDIWWWESNRILPINVFLKSDMRTFRHILRTFNSKDVNVLFGPTVSLSNILDKRVKRKSFQLVRKV